MNERRWGNFNSCCRLCLSEKLGTLKSIFEDASLGQDVVVNIQEFVGVEIKPDDKLSTLVCDKCNLQVQTWKKFKASCFNNQSKLELWMNEWNSNTSIEDLNMSIRIKDEILEDDETDNPTEDTSDGEIHVKSEPIDPIDAIYHVETEMHSDDYEYPPPLSPVIVTEPLLMEQYNPRNSREMNGSVSLEPEKEQVVVSDGRKCLMCNKSFSSVANRHRHDAVFHRGAKRKSEPVKVSVEPEKGQVSSDGKTCLTCNKSFSSVTNRHRHDAVFHRGTKRKSEPEEIRETAKITTIDLLPQKSKEKYEMAYKRFNIYCTSKKADSISENILIAYFSNLSEVMRASTLWSTYSMLRSTLIVKKNINIAKYHKLRAFLKHQAAGYKAKKTKTLTKEDVQRFIVEAPDEKFLMIKVALMFGIAGACRRDELAQMSTQDIEDLGSKLLITVPDSESKKSRYFIVNGAHLDIYRKYCSLRPKNFNSSRFFFKYVNGKSFKQVVGIHQFGKMPGIVASFLNLPCPKEYTGHCFRMSSATILADKGANIKRLKAEECISSSVNEKCAADKTRLKTEDCLSSSADEECIADITYIKTEECISSSAEEECMADITDLKTEDDIDEEDIDDPLRIN